MDHGHAARRSPLPVEGAPAQHWRGLVHRGQPAQRRLVHRHRHQVHVLGPVLGEAVAARHRVGWRSGEGKAPGAQVIQAPRYLVTWRRARWRRAGRGTWRGWRPGEGGDSLALAASPGWGVHHPWRACRLPWVAASACPYSVLACPCH